MNKLYLTIIFMLCLGTTGCMNCTEKLIKCFNECWWASEAICIGALAPEACRKRAGVLQGACKVDCFNRRGKGMLCKGYWKELPDG